MRYRPKMPSVNSDENLMVTSMEAIRDDLIDLHTLNKGLSAYTLLTASVEDISIGDYSSETVLDANRALHQIADVTGDEELRPNTELDSFDVLTISTENILATAFKAILKILTWIITAPIRFVRWLFDRIKQMKVQYRADTAATDEAVAKLKEMGGDTPLSVTLKHQEHELTEILNIRRYFKNETDSFTAIAEAMAVDARPIVLTAKRGNIEDIGGNFDINDLVVNREKIACLGYVYAKAQENVGPYHPYQLKTAAKPRGDKTYTVDIHADKLKDFLINPVKSFRKKAYDAMVEHGDEVIANVKLIQTHCEGIKKELNVYNQKGTAIPDNIHTYVQCMSLYLSKAVQNSMSLETLAKQLSVMYLSVTVYDGK